MNANDLSLVTVSRHLLSSSAARRARSKGKNGACLPRTAGARQRSPPLVRARASHRAAEFGTPRRLSRPRFAEAC